MHPTLLSLADARLAWHLHVDHTNLQNKPKVYTRLSKDGVQQTIIRRPRTVCDGAKTTGEMLIQRARKATQQLLNSPFLFNALATDTGELAPRIEVNGRELGQKRSLSKVTMRAHLKQLIQAGLILNKKTHGWQKDIELWINPEFVWETVQKPVEKHTEPDSGVQHISSFLCSESIKLSTNEVLETNRNSKVIVGDCEKLSDCPTGNPLTGNGGKQESLPDVVGTSKEGAGGRAAARTAQSANTTEALAEQMAVAQKKGYCVSTWEYSKAMIYRDTRKTWTAEEERKALIAIWNGVYGGFRDPNCDYSAFHDQVIRRVELVRIHFDLHPGRYAPLPYSEIHAGRGYFDAENEHGFAGTRRWYLNDLARKNKEALEVALLAAAREMKQRRDFDRRGEKARVPRRIKNHTLLQLHSEHYRIINRLGGENGLYRFAKKLAQLKLVASATA